MTLDEYSHDRWNDFHSCGGNVTHHTTLDLAPGVMLQIEAAIVFRTFREGILEVDEVVVMKDGQPHRLRYSYRFEFQGLEVFRYDRDPRNHPEMPEHKHVGGRRIPSDRATFRQVVEEAWDWIDQRDAESEEEAV
jgi:hypothetical protein